MMGLAIIATKNVRVRGAAVRWATAAAVSHCSSRLLAVTSRASVRPTACSMSHAWCARNVSCSSTRAMSACRSSLKPRMNTRQPCARGGPPTSCSSRASTGNTTAPIAIAVHAEGVPGSTVQPARNNADQRRRHQAAPQVVENLPARDERQAVALDAVARRHVREQPPQDLPVAPHPPVLPLRMREHARGIVVHDLDVADERGAGVHALEQVVRQQRVLRHAAVERRVERIDVVKALAGVDAFAEQVLIHVRHRGGVGVDAGVAGVGPREQRSGGAGHGHADARLQDAVALHHQLRLGIDDRPVQRMRDDADELARGLARQLRIRVERDAIPDRRQDLELARPWSRSWCRWRRAAGD